ncbi:hypothetical protein TWF506_007263 [Arthrobotrys conoides]|uniref:Nucleoside phosphorylase domain-containing protein n=1 Tax=Arthrobotrys conoides TaxID=74498 RepID=A0AAN8RUE2_9PEZI
MASLPKGRYGLTSAAVVSTQTQASFPSIKQFLLVGIGGGVPRSKNDIRLEDVVVSSVEGRYPGVIQYDFGKIHPYGNERIGYLKPPSDILLSAVAKVEAAHKAGYKLYAFWRERAGAKVNGFGDIIYEEDVLYTAEYIHVQKNVPCKGFCDKSNTLPRQPRTSGDEPVVHHGIIASGNQVVRNDKERDRISKGLKGVICFEMEAAGVMASIECLVIRAICDYADSHKNKGWQAYAARTAAAYAKEILSVLTPPATVGQPVNNSLPTHNRKGVGWTAIKRNTLAILVARMKLMKVVLIVTVNMNYNFKLVQA